MNELVRQNENHAAVRNRLMNPKNIVDKAAALDAETKRLRTTVLDLRDAVAERDALIAVMKDEAKLMQASTNALYLRVKKAEANLLAESDKQDVMQIIEEVLRDFGDITFMQILIERGNGPLAAPRRACLIAVVQKRPDLSYPKLAKIFMRDHSTIHRVLKRAGVRRR